jgi:predicted outer membrane lipoprotein
MLWFTHIFIFFLGAFIAILFSVRNPTIAAWVNRWYLKGREKGAKETEELYNKLKDRAGSIPVSPVSGNTLIKYLLRFGVPLAGAFGLVAALKPSMVETMLYKCCMIFVGYMLAELIWVLGYKRTFSILEKNGGITDVGRIAILIFRGLLLGSVILGLTLGL